MDKLFKEEARVSINGGMATLYPAGPDQVSVLYDDQRNTIVDKEVILKAYREQKLLLIDESGIDLTINDQGEVDQKTLWRLAYVSAVLALKKGYKSRPKIQIIINQVAANYPNIKKPSVSAVFNWVTKAERTNQHEARASVLKSKKRKCDSRVSDEINQLIFDAIDAFYMTPLVSTISKAYRKFKKEFRKRFPENNIKDPHKSTFYHRIKELCPFEKELKRKGRAAAKLLRRTAIQEMCAKEILEQVQLDAVHLNIPLYDDEDNYLGKPVVHIAIDVYSRAVMGFSVELDSESSAGVIECIKNGVSTKLHEDHPYTLNKWKMYGKPLEMVSDGGSAYVSETVTTVLSILNIIRLVNRSYTPWHKAIVERFNRTLRWQFAALFKSYVGRKKDGRDLHTLKKFNERVTLNKFCKALTCYIVDDYNQSPHNSLLERTPNSMWSKSAELAPPIVPHTLSRALLLKGDVKSATLHHVQGIRVNCVFYNSQELQDAYVIQYGEKIIDKNKVTFLYNPLNINSITVRMDNRLISVPVYKADYPVHNGMSLVENKVKRLKTIKEAREEYERLRNRIDIDDRLGEFVNEESITEVVDQSKKRGPSMPIDPVNKKMEYSKEAEDLSEGQIEEDMEDEVSTIDTHEYLTDLVFEEYEVSENQ